MLFGSLPGVVATVDGQIDTSDERAGRACKVKGATVEVGHATSQGVSDMVCAKEGMNGLTVPCGP